MHKLFGISVGGRLSTFLLTCGLLGVPGAQAAQFNLNVVDGDGNPVSGFRWLLQEDTTYALNPDSPGALTNQLSLNFHKSHHPLALTQGNANSANAGKPLSGNEDSDSLTVNYVAPGRYYLSVLPYSGYSLSGAPVTVLANAADPDQNLDDVTVVVEEQPIPTAQIAIYLFHDCYPLNGTPDLPEEEPGSGSCVPGNVDFSQFQVQLEEPAGKYGANGGPLLQDAFGNTIGLLTPNSDGTLLVKNLAPGKYGVKIIPPTGGGWVQTSTIEGTSVNDAWVKAKEPPFMVEFGLPGPHVFFGFTKQRNDFTGGSATITGTITDMHMSRPPSTQFFSGRPFPQCWVAVNEGGAAPGINRFSWPCNGDSSFSIPNVPPGNYELKVFDKPLDVVIATQAFTVDPAGTCNGGQSCDFGEVPVFNWFNRLNTYLFNDTNQDGFWDVDEVPLGAESGPVNVRWRDGTVYQSFPTDTEGAAPFDESFPWFHWMVAEVGFTSKKATGATIVVDAGGDISAASSPFTGFPNDGELVPQAQSENGGAGYRTETGPVLTQAFQGFLGQTNVIAFGKADYLNFTAFDPANPGPPQYIGENGGISGIVFNTVTRAENDPELAVGEGWEPGVPRVQVNLYADGDIDSPLLGDPAFPDGTGDIDWNGDGAYQADDNLIDDVDGDGVVTLSDVDNYPLGWASGGKKGAEDVDRNGNGNFDLGDAIAVAWTDSWDDNTPTNCQGENNLPGVADNRCFDGMRNWNQVRPGVFDGGYAFNAYDLTHLADVRADAAAAIEGFYDYVAGLGDSAANVSLGLLPGDYIVEATTPPGYKTLREHHKNVDFGDEYVPWPDALPPTCVGPDQEVPPYFALATKDGSGAADQLIPGMSAAEAAAPFAGELRPVCDQKLVPLSGGQNAAADFFLVSEVPVAANVSGVILNDLANEFNPNTPNFGEKYAPPLLPVGFYDWNGKEVNRVYADEFGRYNAMVPSTWSANLPQPSGMSPNVLLACMNDAGPIEDPNNPGELMVDPHFNPAFSQFCYTFQYMPGSTTYLDTPVVAIAAFTNPDTNAVDCEVPQYTPMVRDVRNASRNGVGPIVVAGEQIRIRSMGAQGARNYNFGNANNEGLVELEDADGNRIPLTIDSWAPTNIVATVPTGTALGEYQVVVTRVGGVPAPVESEIGVTLTVGQDVAGTLVGQRGNGDVYTVWNVSQGESIQDAIDAADSGDLILIGPGEYDELLVMWKPVKLQGWGAGSVTLNARQIPTNKVELWREKIDGLIADGSIQLLPGQNNNVGGFQALGAPAFPTEEGAGIFVTGRSSGRDRFVAPANRGARIDGIHIVGASQGGGIVVNGHASYLNIGNNRLEANAGFYGGGIRLGHPGLTANQTSYTDADNRQVRIHHNQVIKNGSVNGAGGGISLYTGSTGYSVDNNWICGNFSQGNGGGIAHSGLSNLGSIEDNDILFNESFSQAASVQGGGIFIGGETPLGLTGGLFLSEGAGNVTVNANRIHGNLAGAGDGGGIAIVSASGIDVATNLDDSTKWYDVRVFNNMITNNVSGRAGAVMVQDSVETHIQNNTIAHNDSTATVALAFEPGNPNQSIAMPAGVVSRLHSPDISTLLVGATVPANAGRDSQYRAFSDANLDNNILFGNRAFYWENFDPTTNFPTDTGLVLAGTDDLGVLDGFVDTGDTLFVRYGLLTQGGDDDNGSYGGGNLFTTNPRFVNSVQNQGSDGLVQTEATISTGAALDEGGNFIQVSFAPLSIVDESDSSGLTQFDYHILVGSPAISAGRNVGLGGPLGEDFDKDPRTNGNTNEIGADELP
ncbi:hypothetical protein G3480_01255 [Thiorhodococcus mannitoliphagus]|uniref:Probable pectate lyase C n=1 Tax=Thiorhodococcus mannitoliphagus TaxID=329406 RepID=A0A6P1DTB4_9GAMM|nr:hypothetical protein [Thiorhodococcus mannitoliphagus]NEX18955.1 hypothetical protein [Thiorhodococcus mannitoliphagus]